MSRAPVTTRAPATAPPRSTLLRALVGALALGGVLAALLAGPVAAPAEARAHAAESSDEEPLQVTMTSLTPAAIPATGLISISGLVTNASSEDWQDVNISPFVSTEPITSRDDLALAAATDPAATVGTRLTDLSTLAAVGDLAAGATAQFSLRIPVTSLGISGETGVYWIGVHALGANAEGRDQVADGRARTFIPLLPQGRLSGQPTPVSLVLPFRERVRRDADGRLNGPARWSSLTGDRGRLTRLAELAASAGSTPVSWIVDPAVLDALADYGRGNPGLSLAARKDTAEPAADSSSPSAGGSPSASPSASSDTPTDDERAHAKAVLEGFVGSARSADLLTVGYADPDVVSLARRRSALVTRADALARRSLAARGLEAQRTVAPPDGYFDPTLLTDLPRDSLMLLGDQGRDTFPTSTRLPSGQPLVLSDSRASAGGPGPSRSYDALAVRQRILAESLLEQLAPSSQGRPRPMVVELPPRWDPGVAWREADLFGSLQAARWLRLVPLDRSGTTTYAGELPYGRTQLVQEVGEANVAATRSLARTGSVLGHLLTDDNDVSDTVTGAALSSSSYSARETRRLAVEQADALEETVRRTMNRVQVSLGVDFVVLSGGSGDLTVTLVNGLKQPITVGIRARTDSSKVKIQVPAPVRMGPGQRSTMRLPVTSTTGVYDVSLVPVTSEGEEAGKAATFSLRTSQVGRLIWFILAGGAALLAVMIVRRIVLRIRLHRWRLEENGTAT